MKHERSITKKGKDMLKIKKTRDIVVSRYQENVDWAKNAIIYNKGPQLSGTTSLPNVGREAHTYLYHIINKYDDLPDHTIFLQGNPFDHCPDVMEKIGSFDKSSDFIGLGKLLVCDIHGCPHHCGVPMKAFAERINKVRDKYEFYAGAQFIVSKAAIQSNPVQYYKDLIQTCSHHVKAIEAWCFERAWKYIFNQN